MLPSPLYGECKWNDLAKVWITYRLTGAVKLIQIIFCLEASERIGSYHRVTGTDPGIVGGLELPKRKTHHGLFKRSHCGR